MRQKLSIWVAITLTSVLIGGCSPARLAANLAGKAIAGGNDVYASEEDPELVAAALPFGLKTMEGLIGSAPENVDLRLAAARGFAGYAYLAREIEGDAVPHGTEARRAFDRRVARLFLRGRDHALAGLEARHPGFAETFRADPEAAMARTDAADAALLYWAGAAWSGAIAADKRDIARLAELPQAAALVERVTQVEEGFDDGAAHEVLMLFEAGRPGGSLEQAEAHYRRAVALSDGLSAGAHVGYAEAIAVARQDRAAFRRALEEALAIDTDAVPDKRLVNVLAQRRARELAAEEEQLFITVDGGIS